MAIRACGVEAGGDLAVRAAVLAVVRASMVGGMIETVTHDPLFAFGIVRVGAAPVAGHQAAGHPRRAAVMDGTVTRTWPAGTLRRPGRDPCR